MKKPDVDYSFLLNAIRDHEARPHAGFRVVAIQALGPHILAVCDHEGEYTVYFDRRHCRIDESQQVLTDTGPRIPDFPENVGFLVEVMSRNWDSIRQVAKHFLVPTGKNPIEWYDSVGIPVEY